MSDTSVVSVKVPPHLREEVRRSKEEIDWPEEIRDFIRHRLSRRRAARALARTERKLAYLPLRPRGTAAGLVREDRDRR